MNHYDGLKEAIRIFCEEQDKRGIPRATQKGFIDAVFENQGQPWFESSE